jgi:hypothetical protein
MNKITGPVSDYAPLRDEGSRITVCYGLQQPEQAGGLASWYEVYLYKRQHATVTLQDVKQAVLADINARTTEIIVSGLVWTSADGEQIPVWLSVEQQLNFMAAYTRAIQTSGANLPVTFKMGEDAEGQPVYHTFVTMTEAEDFYQHATDYIHRLQTAGWQEKDSIDWQPYETLFSAGDAISE